MKKLLLILICIFSITLVGSTATAYEPVFQIELKLGSCNGMDIYTLTDNNSGVEYIVVRDKRYGSVAMTPRYRMNNDLYR